MKICFASHNANKIKELNELISGRHEIIGLSDLGISEEIPETGDTFEENSTIKAKYIFDRFRMPVFADDSGLIVDALNGAPGVYSARYAGAEKNNKANIQLLLDNLGSSKNRDAYFISIITFIDQEGNKSQFGGTVNGKIIHQERGENGFGYDPIFIPHGYEKTFAELPSSTKNEISHRAKAVRKLIKYLSSIDE